MSFISYTQITDTHDNISKGGKIILSLWIFHLCRFPVHSVLRQMMTLTQIMAILTPGTSLQNHLKRGKDTPITINCYFLGCLSIDRNQIIYGGSCRAGSKSCKMEEHFHIPWSRCTHVISHEVFPLINSLFQ